ncbi:MAG: glycosyltransferase family A protein [Planctomycetota bacterium]
MPSPPGPPRAAVAHARTAAGPDQSRPKQPRSGALPRTLVISPVRNEAAYLQRTIDAVVAQTVRPTLWLIVDDGSTDETPQIAARAAEQHAWIRLHRRPDRGTRQVGGGVIEAFNDGLRQFALDEFDYLCKLDGDLEFSPTYLERMYARFAAEPRLGTASGKCWLVTPTGLQLERTHDAFSLGAFKLYRRQCFQDIGGFVCAVMWDGIDCHRCRMRGWEARSFRDEELRILHLRRMGSSFRSVYHGRLRWGRGQYFMGTHPLYALAIAAYRLAERPWVFGGALILAGYFEGYVRRLPRYEEPEFRRFLRRWQLRRLGIGGRGLGIDDRRLDPERQSAISNLRPSIPNPQSPDG